ncbi:MAG: hypothetical protein ISR91_07590, partial [Candidatus Delongbacteria bacterium]|nr:hypothetical protein [Candidatus Delongbacteria bacterium]
MKRNSLILTLLLATTALAARHTIDPGLTTGVQVINGHWGNSTLECT